MREMKDSGIEWIGAIPTTWHTQKMKYISNFTQNKYSSDYGLLPYIGLENIASWSGSFISTNSQYDREQSLICEPEDILFGKLRPYLAKVYMNDRLCCCSNEFAVIRVNGQNKRYMWYQLLSHGFIFEIDRSTYGTKMPRANAEFIRNVFVALPSEIEQQKIANYLDKMCAEIDTVLEKTRASIEEYKKLKQAVITQAVTKGVRGDRPMKNSGIEWIGEIPAGVLISRMGLHFDIVLGKMLCSAPVDDNYTLESYYCAADIHFEGISNGEKKKMWFSPVEKEQYCVRKGDLLVVEGGAGAGGCAIAVGADTPMYIQNSIMIVRSKGISNIRYLRYLLECLVKKGYIDVLCNKATIPHFTKDKLANVPFIVFPQGEQEEIADYLDDKCSGIDALIAKKQQYLTEIENYKKSLIYEYVTGKKEIV